MTSECSFTPLAALRVRRYNIDSLDSRCGYVNAVEY